MDSDPEVLGSVHGDLKSLDLTSSTYIGAVPALLDLAAFNMGTSQGLVGCIRRLKWNHRIIRLLLLDNITAHQLFTSNISKYFLYKLIYTPMSQIEKTSWILSLLSLLSIIIRFHFDHEPVFKSAYQISECNDKLCQDLTCYNQVMHTITIGNVMCNVK